MNHRSHACVKQVLVAGFLFGQQNVLRAKQEGCYYLKKVEVVNAINVKGHSLLTMKNTLNLEHSKLNIGWWIKLATNVWCFAKAGLLTTKIN